MIPQLLAIIIIGLLHGLFQRQGWYFWLRLGVAGCVALLLNAARLTAIASFMKNFPRNDYALPGARGPFEAIWLMVHATFIHAPGADAIKSMVTNLEWRLDRHEWEFSVSFIPLLLFGYLAYKIIMRIMEKRLLAGLSLRKYATTVVIALLASIPLMVNSYNPSWNEFLKKIPVSCAETP